MESNTYRISLQKMKGTWVTYIIILGIGMLFFNFIIGIAILLFAGAFYIKYRKDPENLSSLYYNLAINLYSKKEINKAKQALQLSIDYDKLNKQSYFFLGCILFDEKDYKNSLDYLKKGGADEINDPSLVYVLGRCYFHEENFNKAIEYLEKISYNGLETLEKERLYTLGKAYIEKEEYEKGYEILDKISISFDELKGETLEFCYYKAVASFYTDRHDIAKELITKVYNTDKYYKYIDIYAKEIGLV